VEINPTLTKIEELRRERLEEVLRELEDPAVWNNPEQAQQLGKERAQLETVVEVLSSLGSGLSDSEELLQMAEEENDEATWQSVEEDLGSLEAQIAQLEFQRMFSGEHDTGNAFVDIQSLG